MVMRMMAVVSVTAVIVARRAVLFGQPVTVGVIMIVAASVIVTVVVAFPDETFLEQKQTQAGDDQAGAYPQPRVKTVRDNVARRAQGQRPEQVDTSRMRGSHDEPEEERVARGSTRRYQVGGDHSLAVTRFQGVKRAQPRRHTGGHEQQPKT